MPIARSGDADISYEITGEGEPLLMIMGFVSDSRMWILQTPAFSPHYKCITFDNRGVGMSSRPPGPYTMEQMAGDALAVMDDAGIERAHVLGVSMGGAIAQNLALKAPERVKSLTLAVTWCHRNPWLDRLSDIGRHFASMGHDEFGRGVLLFLFSPAFVINNPEMIAMIEQMVLEFEPPPETFVNQLAAVVDHDVREQLATLTLPALVVSARRDIMVPPELGEIVATSIPGARFELLDGGHAVNAENAAEFNRVILEFLQAT
jgi:pimeloyl-ACP methyl ester carboxylesterase